MRRPARGAAVIEVTRRGEVAVLRMAHGRANALDPAFCRALEAALRSPEAEAARALVLTASGSIFSAGVDLVQVRDGGPDAAAAMVPAFESMFAAVALHPRPVVAAINGHAVAGGCVLALACDARVAAEGPATLGVPELRVGVPFPPVAFDLVRAAVGPAALRALVLEARMVGPAEALAMGLVDEVVPAERLLDRALARAEALAAVPPAAFALAKRQLRGWGPGGPPSAGGVGAAEAAAAWRDPAVLAAVERRVRDALRK